MGQMGDPASPKREGWYSRTFERAYWRQVRARAWRRTCESSLRRDKIAIGLIAGPMFAYVAWLAGGWTGVTTKLVAMLIAIATFAVSLAAAFIYWYNAVPAQLLREAEEERDALRQQLVTENQARAVPEGLLELLRFGRALWRRIEATRIQEWRGNRDGPLRKEVHVWKDQVTAAAAMISPRRAAVLASGWGMDDDGKEIRNVAPDVVPSSKHDVELYLANILRRLERLLDEG